MTRLAAKAPQEHRGILLKAITVGVLLLSMGVAWLLVRTRSLLVGQGGDIIARIRGHGLGHYWGKGRQTDWYLHHNDRGVAGWGVSVRLRKADGRFEGLNVVFQDGRLAREHWRLDNRAGEGYYEALQELPRDPRLPRVLRTTITLTNGKIKLLHRPANVTGEAKAPDNYGPEGMLDLACYVAARGDSPARFAVVFNLEVPKDGTVRFGSIVAKDAKQTEDGWQVTIAPRTAGGQEIGTKKLLFDDTGRLIRRTSEDGEDRLVSQEQVREHFPHAPQYLSALLRAAKMPEPDE